jgi:ATP/maltotriose-dependent transcriptional regulator MalT
VGGDVLFFPPRGSAGPPAGLEHGRLRPPPRPPGALPRTRLIRALEAGLWRKVTQVVGPPGVGKSTLLAAWLAQTRWPAGWLGVTPEDRAPGRGLGHLLAAAGRACPGLGAEAEALARVPGPYAADVVLVERLWAPLAASGARAVLVLDDVHHLAGTPLADALAFLAGRAPPGLHLLVSAPEPQAWLQVPREDATLGPEALRLEVAEAAALGASPSEAAALVEDTAGRILWARVALAGGWRPGAVDAPGWARRWAAGLGHEEVLAAAVAAPRLRAAGLGGAAEVQASLLELEAQGALTSLDAHREWFGLHPELRRALGGPEASSAPAQAGDPPGSPRGVVAAGEAALARGDLAAAQASLREAEAALKGYEGSAWSGPVWALAAGVRLAEGAEEAARAAGEAALAALDACPEPGARALAEARWAAAGPASGPAMGAAGLLPRERAVLAEARAGATDQAIAARLGLRLALVKVILHELALRLEVDSRAALIAATRGWPS